MLQEWGFPSRLQQIGYRAQGYRSPELSGCRDTDSGRCKGMVSISPDTDNSAEAGSDSHHSDRLWGALKVAHTPHSRAQVQEIATGSSSEKSRPRPPYRRGGRSHTLSSPRTAPALK